jgi:hypothetical protein
MNKQQTAVEWLAEKYNYVTWMRNRDEISAGTADEWRKHYLQQAKEMEKHQIEDAYEIGFADAWDDARYDDEPLHKSARDYYNKKYNNEQKD